MELKTIYSKFLECSGYTTDTRKIKEGNFFFALKGDKYDANTFAHEALKLGAKYAIIDNPSYYIDERTILVEDSLKTLQQLANHHRIKLDIPIIALTGSNGKTTTKELINQVLSKKFNTKATLGNLNNHIGVPLTLLSFDSNTEMGIVEMGANHQKEIEFLCQIAEPDFGYITNFGKAHLEGFGGVEGVIKGKSELYQYLQKKNKTIFVNLDDPLQNEKTKSLNRYCFSTSDTSANLFIKNINADPMVEITFNKSKISSHLIGFYNANNINAAITIGKYFNISDDNIKEAIESYIPTNNRSQLIQKNANKIILDAYNANPSSMNAAILNFSQVNEPEKKIMILGDMFELGIESPEEHKKIITLVNQQNIQTYFIGSAFYNQQINSPLLYFFKTYEDYISHLLSNPLTNNFLLVKGSRGMALERILEHL